MANNTSMEHMEFSYENVINAVQTEPTLWDPTVKANEEKKKSRGKALQIPLESELADTRPIARGVIGVLKTP